MRFTILAFLLVLIFGHAAWAGSRYIGKDSKAMEVMPAAGQQYFSSFRGIGLDDGPDQMRAHAQSLGFDTFTTYYVGETVTATVNICKHGEEFGSAYFDRQGMMQRLSFKDRYFSDPPPFVRKFADELFERYGVEPARVRDDVCFQDVTCFRGTSKRGEQFLILRIGTEAELFVRPAR